MPFSKPVNYRIKKDCVSLQVHKSERIPEIANNPLCCIWKRAFLFTSPNYKYRGSVTIETLISLLMFMIIVLFIGSFMMIINTQVAMQIHINNIAKDTAKNMFYVEMTDEISEYNKTLKSIKEQVEDKLKGQYMDITESVFDKGYLMAQLVKDIQTKSSTNSQFLYDINWINITDSSIENGKVDLVVKYKIKIPLINKYLSISQRALVKDWTGTDITTTSEKVYITENGVVYHKSKNCSHLIVNISKTTVGQAENKNNTHRRKYSGCQYCVKKKLLSDEGVFITEDGNKYHTSLQCSGLTRRIVEKDISQVEGIRPCSECGKGA